MPHKSVLTILYVTPKQASMEGSSQGMSCNGRLFIGVH